MDVYQEIRERIKKYPNALLTEESYGLSVTPEGGFTVWIASNDKYYSVGFEGWHEDFDSAEEALECFAWGLSNKCRLKIYNKGTNSYKWVTQSLENDEWENVSTTCLLFFAFWKKSNIIYKQNNLITS
ncbi:MAG: hypothetical protein QGG88_08470 [Gammaproteobacteria bacterium]|nr:hypothetical protein [Gammaproteobacteria bacterium]